MKTIKHSVALALMVGLAPHSSPLLAADKQLQQITARAIGKNQTEVQLQFNTPVHQLPKSFTLDNPSRLVFDFPATEVSPNSRNKNINMGQIQSVNAANNQGRARVVVRLNRLVNHSMETRGNTVVMRFDNGKQATTHTPPPVQRSQKAQAQAPTPQQTAVPALPELPVPKQTVQHPNHSYAWYNHKAPAEKAPPTPVIQHQPYKAPAVQQPPAATPYYAAPAAAPVPQQAATQHAPVLRGVDFRRQPNGGGKLIVNLPSSNTRVEDNKRGNTVTLTLNDVDVPKHLQQRMDVLDFGTPVSEVDVSQRGANTRIRISSQAGFEHRTRRHGSEYTVYIDKLKVKPEDKLAQQQKKKKTFTGKKLSLNFQDIEVRAVLQLLADFTNKNIVVSDTVDGNITIRLKDVPWDQALDIVLESKNLAMRENGNVIWVAPAAELAAKEQQELAAIKAKEQLEPLITEYISINFAKAAALAELINQSKGTDPQSRQSLLSSRGKVSVDQRTNTLLVQDTATQVAAIRDLVRALDVPVEQVLIESRIVVANDDFNKELGSRFGISPTWMNKDSHGIGTGNLGEGTDEYLETVSKALADENGGEIKIPGLGDRLSVNMPVTGAAGSFGFSVLSRDFIIDLELSALQAESKGEIIATPRVITSNQTKALIEQGVEIPYLQASSSGATNVAFKKAVLSLEVTPQITPDEHISLDLKVNQDTVGKIFAGVPSINTREVQTKVLVENAQTVVLGGVHEEESINGSNKVPVLGDLPVLGKLFRSSTKSNQKRELLIFVTPKIVDGKS